MVKTKKTALQKMQTGKTMFVAKLFFRIYLTPNIVTKIMHKEAWRRTREKKGQGFVMPYIRDCLKEWESEGFIEKSLIKLPFRVEKKRGEPYWLKNYGYRLNLEPVYRYCKERHNIEFTKEEKAVIDKRLRAEGIRGRIFREYPYDDIINATIKFYIKQYVIPPHLEILDKEQRKLLETLEKMAEKDLKLAEKQMKEINEKLRKNKPSKKDKELVYLDRELENIIRKKLYEDFVDKETQQLKVPIDDLKKFVKLQELLLYITSYKKNPELISSINKKFKKALGILA